VAARAAKGTDAFRKILQHGNDRCLNGPLSPRRVVHSSRQFRSGEVFNRMILHVVTPLSPLFRRFRA
jgi:hypothetical protein